MVFTTILQVFVDSGMANALIQKKDADDLDFSTIVFFNMVLCIILYGGLFLAAPLIAAFYNNSDMTDLIRVLGLIIVISGVKNVQQAYVSKKLIFRKFFVATIFGTIIAAVVGIVMALTGFGIWAIVAQHLVNAFIDTLVLWITVKWRPKFQFSFSRLKGLFSYGWKLLVSSLINTVYGELRQLLIGKVYSKADLGYFNRGSTFPKFIVNNVNSSIDSVLFPVMAKCQDDKERVKRMTRRAIMTSSFVMWPLMLGLMAIGKNMLILLLTETWLPCLPFLYIYCFVYGMQPIHTSNLNAIKAMGRSDLFLKMEITKKTIGILLLLVTVNISVLAIALGGVAYTVIASIVNAFPNKKLLGYGYLEQLKDILPSFFFATAMGVIVYILPLGMLPMILRLIVQIIAGVVIYCGSAMLFKTEAYSFVKETAGEFIDRLKNKE